MFSIRDQVNADDVLALLAPKSDVDINYVSFHRHRYAYLLNVVDALLRHGAWSQPVAVDVGPHYQTQLMRQVFQNLTVNTVGFDSPVNARREGEMHWHADLNDSAQLASHELSQPAQIMTYCEVMEHLYTKAEIVLDFLSEFLVPGGYLIIQTPNAVALHKRIRMLLGKNPYDLILEHREGHFREFTLDELTDVLRNCGYRLVYSSFKNYFSPDHTIMQRLFRKLEPVIPPGLRDGITVVAQKSGR